MALDGFVGLALGAIGLGVVHGVEPGHGWPVAAAYALDRSNKWIAGFAASTILGVGHLVSSIAMVLAFFWAKDYLGLTEVGWMSYVAGVLLVVLGLREYRHYRRGGHHHHDHGHGVAGYGHGDHDHGDGHHRDHGHGDHHDHGDGHHHDDGTRDHVHNGGRVELGQEHGHGDGDHPDPDDGQGHSHDHDHGGGVVGRIVSLLPVDLVPDQPDPSDATDRGILGITAFAFALGFAHEEEFEIIALCVGSSYCLELMLIYALTVVTAIVAFTLLLIAGYEHYEERVVAYADYLPLFSAVVLVLMGFGFLLQVF